MLQTIPFSIAVTGGNSRAVILIVEDDPGDQVLIEEALQASRISKRIQIVRDGREALDYLHRAGRYRDPLEAPRPDLILLDLNMPRLGGKEVLAQVKSDPEMKIIPIVAFTTSGLEEDILQCFSTGVNSYVQKPTDFDKFQAVLRHVEHYWLEVSLLPPRPASSPTRRSP